MENDVTGNDFVALLKAEKEADFSIITSLEKKVYDMKNLIEIGISLSSNLEFQKLVDAVLYSCIGQLFVDKIAILLQEDIDSDSYYIHTHKGYEAPLIPKELRLDGQSNLIQYFQNNPEPHEYDLLFKIKDLEHDLEKLKPLKPLLLIPMMSKSALNGFITVGQKMMGTPFTLDEKEFMRNLARFSATAVENSRLYEMATQDRMTRLIIHHHFQERLLEEFKRSKRNGQPLSLIITDIDHFKKFNDTYGHQQGDVVLKQVAQIMKDTMRASDLSARYGGEEFAVILPDTPLNKAVDAANRLRKKTEEFEFSGQDEPLSVTISIGVAQFDPERDETTSMLIERADKALYKAKDSGRNRVAVYK